MDQLATVPIMRVAVLDDYQGVAHSLAPWGDLDAETVFFDDHISDEDILVARLSGFDVVVLMRERTPMPRSLLERLPDLRLLVTTGSRNASIDVQAANDLSVTVCGTGSLPHPTAELTMALMLALSRGLVGEIQSVREGGWQSPGIGRDVNGATLGLLGLGRLGVRVARAAQAMDMRVVAWSQNLTAQRAAEVDVERVTKEDLLSQSDFVSIHLRLGPRTEHLIGAPEFGLMKPTAFLINTSRGPIVDEGALLEAVRSGSISGAAVDVYAVEPLATDHPFRTEPRILTTPHIGYVTRESYEVFYRGAVEAISAWSSGAPVRVIPAG